jgi:hypothetical protein
MSIIVNSLRMSGFAIMLDLMYPEGSVAASAKIERVCRIRKFGAEA